MNNNKTAKQILKNYRLKLALLCVVYVLLLAIMIVAMKYSILLGMAGIVALGVSVRKPIQKIRERDLESVIFEELDPQKFNELIELGAFKSAPRMKVLCAISLGEYEKALKIINAEKEKARHPVDICNNIYRQGYIYFEKGEFEKLPSVVREYNDLKKKFPQFAVALNQFAVFDKFDAFADEDYEYVVDVCDIDIKEINPKNQNHKLTRINVGFYRAVSLYKLGKLDEAHKGFEDIINFAPKMHKAKLAKEYIDLMNKA